MRWSLCAAVAALFWMHAAAQAEPYDERIVSARDAASRGDAQRLAAFAATPSPHVLEPYVTYWWLANRLARVAEPVPEFEIREFLRQYEGSMLAERLRSDRLKRAAREGQWALFAEEYPRLVAPDQEMQCLAIAARVPNEAALTVALQAQWLTLLDVPEGCQAPMRALATLGVVSKEDIWQRFRRLIESRRLPAARTTAGYLPLDEQPDLVQLERAFEEPSRYLGTPAARNTASRAARETTLVALTRLVRSDLNAAHARWQSLSAGFRREEKAYVMGQFGWMAALGHRPEALDWYGEANDGQVRTPMSDEQLAWQVRAALRAGDWGRVMTAIDAMAAAQRAQPDWVYWLGRAMAAEGRAEEARANWQKIAGEPHFYGILATEALGRSFVWPRPDAPATINEITLVENHPAIRRALALLRLDMRTEALREWSWALRTADDRMLLAAAEFARRQGLYDRAINAAERTRQQHDFSLRYLAPYFESFAPHARANRVDLPWVYGLVRQESRFQPVARSSVGAQGLMQVMPATGRWVADKIGMRDYRADRLADIETNIQLGTAYLRMVFESLGNNPAVASAAYNAGPGRARRWRGTQRLEGAIYAESIPITETRDYVKKVMANAVVYATLFEGRPSSLVARLGTVTGNGGDAPAETLP